MSDALPIDPLPVPENEAERLAALHRYRILGTPPEEAFDRITQLAARLFKMPISLITLIDDKRGWLKSHYGMNLQEMPRDATFCSFAILNNEVLVVPDTWQDTQFSCNPFVQGKPGIRFYAGAPLLTREGFNLGVLCVMDTQPHDSLSAEQRATLVDLAAIVVDELELRVTAQQRERFFNISSDLQVITGLNGYFQWVSPSFERILGWTGNEMITHPWTSFVHPDDLETSEVETANLFEGSQTVQFENRYRHQDGSYRWFLWNAQTDLEEQVIYGAAIDITERKQAAVELQQKNAILDVINRSAPTPIFLKDRQGRMIYANPATLAVLQKPADEVIGYRDCDFCPPKDAAKVMENDRRIMESGRMEVVEESPDGVRTFLGMKVPYRNEAGEVIGLIGVANDITERVQFERDRERTLQQEQVARETAEQANQIKDEFLAVLSHELRTPLNPILGWAKLLRGGKLDATKTAQAIETIERNAKLQVQLIDDLLDISRILRGKLSLEIVPVNLRAVVTAAIETVRLAAEAKAIVIQLDALELIVRGDAGRLQQVIWNLLSNAVKFTSTGGRVEVELSQVGMNAQIQVRDSGKGIKPEFLPYVFEHFRQEDGAITRKFGGLGLGLAIARQIVEMHGGRIRVESRGEGQGTTFVMTIPLVSPASAIPVVEQPRASGADLQGLQILVVDDEPDSREFVAFVLEQAGAIVTCTASGGTALQQIQQRAFDLIVSDVGMPEIDGYQLMQQVRLLGQQMPAIALTAFAGEFNQQQALQAGFQQHLAKPVEPEVLIRAIVGLLSLA
jgi:PAS domain S-box-containing protein